MAFGGRVIGRSPALIALGGGRSRCVIRTTVTVRVQRQQAVQKIPRSFRGSLTWIADSPAPRPQSMQTMVYSWYPRLTANVYLGRMACGRRGVHERGAYSPEGSRLWQIGEERVPGYDIEHPARMHDARTHGRTDAWTGGRTGVPGRGTGTPGGAGTGIRDR